MQEKRGFTVRAKRGGEGASPPADENAYRFRSCAAEKE